MRKSHLVILTHSIFWVLFWGGLNVLGKQPNIVLFLVDDLGWADVGYQGGAFDTPNIDALADVSHEFSNASAPAPLCSPSRAGILTGKHPAELGLTAAIVYSKRDYTPRLPLPAKPTGPPYTAMNAPKEGNYLALGETTVAEVLVSAGFRTAFIGKWHLGTEEFRPDQQGFDHVVGGGHEASPKSYFSPYGLTNFPDDSADTYIEDAVARHAIEFVDSTLAESDDPFFLYVSHYGVHTPLQAPPELVDKYAAKLASDAGGASVVNPTYAAMVEALDSSVGSVVNHLKEAGIWDETVVIFASDNGGLLATDFGKTIVTENGDLRGGKAMIYQGGLQVPLLIKESGQVASQKHANRVNLCDLFPTILEFAGEDSTASYGRSMVPLLRGEEMEPRPQFAYWPHYIPNQISPDDALVGRWAARPSAAVTLGDHKLVYHFEDGGMELYNLEDDPSESLDLSEKMPELADRLKLQVTEWLESTGANLPVPNPLCDPRFGPLTTAAGELWIPYDSLITLEGGQIHFEATDNDPSVLFVKIPHHAGPFMISVSMASSADDRLEVYWEDEEEDGLKPVATKVIPDGKQREYHVQVPCKGKLNNLRLDPMSVKGGRVSIDWIAMRTPKGKNLLIWNF